MIGYYNYTMFLTYLSLASAGLGIVISLSGSGYPYIGMCFLLVCGLCDSFDGMVARTKKNRSQRECKFGIQVDSLCDIVAFGVLPVCIGAALMRTSETLQKIQSGGGKVFTVFLFAIMTAYTLAALIRLAYFNVTEEERQSQEDGARKFYTGLPVTSAAIIFPTILLINYLFLKVKSVDLAPIYFVIMGVAALAFVLKFQLKKPGLKAVLAIISIGTIEGILMIIALACFKK
ncbi:MAG: CDP-alcohol phosphatidyltransferase family protein [Clostridia bacterium]|nr:CDP-alcohol phosphatidyltransferase family protein [Clostridia bacterium]